MADEKTKYTICVVLVDRANYGRLKPVMGAIRDSGEFNLQVVCSGTMVLERFDYSVKVVREDGFEVDGEVFIELEGSTPTTMAKSIGFATIEFAGEFQRLKPDFLLMIGDRYEAIAAAIAAVYMNITLIHFQGGEVSGSIDESARHAITKFAHYHYPSTERAAKYLVRMGERPKTILGIGCPSSDIARTVDTTLTSDILNKRGSGAVIDPSKPFFLVLFHPVTTEYGGERQQMRELLESLGELKHPTVLLWPNIDAGSDHISKQIRLFRDHTDANDWLRTLVNLTPDNYLRVLSNATMAVGNSSSFVRDASYFGTPVLLVGSRQDGRELDEHVIPVRPYRDELLAAAKAQLAHGRYAPSTLYGDGYVAQTALEKLREVKPYRQKRLAYIYDEPGYKPTGD